MSPRTRRHVKDGFAIIALWTAALFLMSVL
jgi:hypothetical protein